MRSIPHARFAAGAGAMILSAALACGLTFGAPAQQPPPPPGAAATPPAASKPAEKSHPLFNYDVDDKQDIADIEYWERKFDAIMMEDAIKTHQPQGPISIDLAVMQRELPALIKKYPDNANLKKWQARAKEIDSKLDPNADRGKSFKPGFLWDDNAFKQAWVSLHLGKMALADKDYDTAFMHYANAKEKLNQLLTMPDRMDDWPEEGVKWVKDMKPIADEKRDELAKKTHHN
jgi:hypothetical protein